MTKAITIVDSASTSTTGASNQAIWTGTPTVGSVATLSSLSSGTVAIDISGTWTGTLSFEQSPDGINYTAVDAMQDGVDTVVQSATANGLFKIAVAADYVMRVRATASITGTANVAFTGSGITDLQHVVVLNASAVGGNVGGKAAAGSPPSGNPVLVAGSDGANVRTLATDALGNQIVVGSVASGVTDAGAPVKVGGKANTATPSAVAAGQRVDAWFTLTGKSVVAAGVPVSTGDGSTNAAMYIAADTGGGSGATVTYGSLSNGGSWDRQRNNTDLSLLVSAARTAATASPDQVNYNGRGVRVVLSVTAASGTGGLQLQVQGKDSISASYYQLNATPAAVTATGVYVYDLYPSALSAAANGITQVTQAILPRTWRINIAVGDASSNTYSVSAVTIL